jgi:hypothetical protein
MSSLICQTWCTSSDHCAGGVRTATRSCPSRSFTTPRPSPLGSTYRPLPIVRRPPSWAGVRDKHGGEEGTSRTSRSSHPHRRPPTTLPSTPPTTSTSFSKERNREEEKKGYMWDWWVGPTCHCLFCIISRAGCQTRTLVSSNSTHRWLHLEFGVEQLHLELEPSQTGGLGAILFYHMNKKWKTIEINQKGNMALWWEDIIW